MFTRSNVTIANVLENATQEEAAHYEVDNQPFEMQCARSY
jgi:hypothetical protein